MRKILWWGLGILGALVLLGALGVWILIDSVSCTNSDPDGQRLLESQAIEDARPAGAELVYGPNGPACAAMFAGPSVLQPERSWSFDVVSEPTATAAAKELVEAAQKDSWSEVPQVDLDGSTTDDPYGDDESTDPGSGYWTQGFSRELTKHVEDRSLYLSVHVFPPLDRTSSTADVWRVSVRTTVGDR